MTMKFNFSQSKIYSSLNFREALQPQYVNKFTIGVCSSSRLLTQYHKFCTQRAEAHLSGATQSSKVIDSATWLVQENTVGVSCKCDSNYCKNLCVAIADCVSALCVEIPKDYEIGLG